MIRKVYTCFDEKAEAFLQPFFCDTDGIAIRNIMACLENSEHPFAKYPSDYTLFALGTYDDVSGELATDKKPLGNLVEYLNKKED